MGERILLKTYATGWLIAGEFVRAKLAEQPTIPKDDNNQIQPLRGWHYTTGRWSDVTSPKKDPGASRAGTMTEQQGRARAKLEPEGESGKRRHWHSESNSLDVGQHSKERLLCSPEDEREQDRKGRKWKIKLQQKNCKMSALAVRHILNV